MTDKAVAAWAARRALAEGGAPLGRLALACGLSVAGVARRARREGWRFAREARELTRAERIARVHDRLLGRVEQAQLQAEADGALTDKAAISELSAITRMLAKIAEGIRDDDAAKEKEQEMERDADIADILARLDAKIVELARHLAEEMARDGVFAGGTGQGQP